MTNPAIEAAALPLTGVKVVELAQNIAGPFAGEILGMLGADVVKIERPGTGDDCRGWGPPFIGGAATTYQTVNRNKRSVTVDLKDPAQMAWLRGFIATRDVLVQNLRPGVMEELGLDAASLRAENPGLVYCSVGAFGHKGPMALRPGYEPILQAFSGIFSVNGEEGGPTMRAGMQVLDLGSGVWAALGCLAALLRRKETGEGCVVDTSLFETALSWLTVHYAGFGVTRTQPARHRSGNPKLCVFQSFETSDGEIVVAAANDRLFAKLCKVLGHPEWATDPRFQDNAGRVAHKPVLIPLIAGVLRTDTCEHWSERLEAVGVPCSPIHDLAQVAALPQTEALGMMQPIPDLGLTSVGLPLSFDGLRPPTRNRAPHLGEHNAVLRAEGGQ
jgi:crotonobetainyl-CoA:carnitine CoA-transferase CaiB-like acyl-CoA transferase